MREISARAVITSIKSSAIMFSILFLIFIFSINVNHIFGADISLNSQFYYDSLSSVTIKIKDNRRTEPDIIHYFQKGLDADFETIKMIAPVSEFVERSFSLNINQYSKNENNRLTIIIDRFRFYNINNLFNSTRVFDCSIRCIEESDNETKGINIRRRDTIAVNDAEEISFADQIERTLLNIVEEFNSKIDSESQQALLKSNDLQINTAQKDIVGKNELGSTTIIHPDSDAFPALKKDETISLSLNYSRGEKVKNGIQMFVKFLKRSETTGIEYGYGGGVNYSDILNRTDGYKGYFFSFELPVFLNYHPIKIINSYFDIFFGISLRLNSGNETIERGSGFKENSIFIGPILEQYLGITLFNAITIEAGVYELALFGSKLLPSDIGGKLGFNINF